MATQKAAWLRRARSTLAASLGAVLLAACARTPPAPASLPAPQASLKTLPAEPAVAPRPARKPAPPALLASLPPKAQPPGPRGFEQLQGLDQDGAMALLGPPLERAESPPAVLWRYAKKGCALDLYFYLDLQSREMRVLHYEVRITDGSERTQQGCYGELVAARRADEAGSADRPR